MDINLNTVITALIASIPPIILAWRGIRIGTGLETSAQKSAEKLDEVHVLVNSKMTEIKDKLAKAEAEIIRLTTSLNQLIDEKNARTRIGDAPP